MSTPTVMRAATAWAIAYKRTWRGSVFTIIVTPLLFLAAMGLGLGSLVDHGGRAHELGGVDYLSFVAPGLLAAAAMQTAAGESTWPVMEAIRWTGSYKVMLTTPLDVADVTFGHLLWMTARVAITCVIFTVVMVLFGAAHSAGVVLAVLGAILTGAAFAGPIAAYTAMLKGDGGLSGIIRFGIVPMFLFSGTFFPVSELPGVLQPVAWATPLWHGVDLCRSLSLGTATLGRSLAHVAYLVLWTVGGAALAVRAFRRKLVV